MAERVYRPSEQEVDDTAALLRRNTRYGEPFNVTDGSGKARTVYVEFHEVDYLTDKYILVDAGTGHPIMENYQYHELVRDMLRHGWKVDFATLHNKVVDNTLAVLD